MEEEVREILKVTLEPKTAAGRNLAESIQRRFSALGGVELPAIARDAMRTPPNFDE
jgi:hypothetical protein